MKYIRARLAAISGFALLCLFTNLYGAILLKNYGPIAFAQENVREEIDGTTPHISGALASPDNLIHAGTESTNITSDKEEMPSKKQKNTEQDIQSIDSHLSGSTSGVVLDGTTPHISGALASPDNLIHAGTESTNITSDKEEMPSKKQKNTEQDIQSIDSHLSGSTSGVVLDGNQ